MTKIKKIMIAILIIILLSSTTNAYIPKEYQNKQYMTDYDVYMVSKDHMNQHWANYNMEILVSQYTNGWRCYGCLDEVMLRKFNTEIKVKTEKVQKLPIIIPKNKVPQQLNQTSYQNQTKLK